MTNTKNLEYAFIPLVLALMVCGCGQDAPVSGRSVTSAEIEFLFAPDAAMQENITSIEITISAPGSDAPLESRLVYVDDTGRDKQPIETSFLLPVDLLNLTLTVTALEQDCPVLEFRGTKKIEPDGDDLVIISVELSPPQTIISIRSEQDKVKVGDNYVLNIYVQDASNLVGFACDLSFNEDLLELQKIEAGELLEGRTELLNLADFLPLEQNNSPPIALAFTEKAGTGEKVCGSGSIFRLSFMAKDAGTDRLKIPDDSVEVWILVDNDFREIKDSEKVKLEMEHSIIIVDE